MFWQDVRAERKAGIRSVRPLAPIPETGWRAPRDYPNLTAARLLSFDVETWDPELQDHGPGWARGKGHIVGFSVGTEDGYRWYFPIRHTVCPEQNLNPDHALAWLRDTMSNPRQPKAGANLIYDVGWSEHEGVHIAGELIDVQFAEALLDERAAVNLEALSLRYLGIGKESTLLEKWIMDSYAPSKMFWRAEIYRSPPSLVGPYGEGDADRPLRLLPHLYRALEAEDLLGLFRMECALIPLLVRMRLAGVSVDIPKAERLRDALLEQGKETHKQLEALVGHSVNINASASLARAFDELGIPYPRTAPSERHPNGQPSFRKEFLDTLEHPVGQLIRDERRMDKLRGTFVEGYVLDGHVNGKVYGSFNPLRGDDSGTVSGRFSGDNPNLQNIPARDPRCVHGKIGWNKDNRKWSAEKAAKEGRCPEPNCPTLGNLMRSIFIPDPGHRRWRKYDYSQIEFRFLVHYAVGPGSDDVRTRYNRDPSTDYHKMVQRLIEEATHREWDRRPVKNLNFGIVFGMGEEKAARSTGLNGKDVEEFLHAYHTGAPFVKPTMQWAMDTAETAGLLRTILGRRARFDLWEPRNWKHGAERSVALPLELAVLQYGRVRRAYLHKALNRLLQGSAADMMKAAMFRCWTEGVFDRTGVPRLTVHDELDFSDTGECDDAFREMQHIMETAIPLRIPVLAEGDWGPDWGNVEAIPLAA